MQNCTLDARHGPATGTLQLLFSLREHLYHRYLTLSLPHVVQVFTQTTHLSYIFPNYPKILISPNILYSLFCTLFSHRNHYILTSSIIYLQASGGQPERLRAWMDSGAHLPGFKFWLCLLLALKSWAKYQTLSINWAW